jgi:hypothetical protein
MNGILICYNYYRTIQIKFSKLFGVLETDFQNTKTTLNGRNWKICSKDIEPKEDKEFNELVKNEMKRLLFPQTNQEIKIFYDTKAKKLIKSSYPPKSFDEFMKMTNRQ